MSVPLPTVGYHKPDLAKDKPLTETRLVLDYAPPESSQLALEERDGFARVIFPVLPRWVYILQIVGPIFVGCLEAAKGIMFAFWMWKLARVMPRPLPTDLSATFRLWMMEILIYAALAASFWWSVATYEWWKHRRWGRVSRVLTATAAGLVQSKLGWWRMRERKWPADQFTAVELKRGKWVLSRKRTIGFLLLRRRRGWPLHFRLSSVDPQLPVRISERLASILGCPMRPDEKNSAQS